MLIYIHTHTHFIKENIFIWHFYFQNAAVLPQVLVKNGKNMYRFVLLLRKFAKSKKVNLKD